MLFRVNSSAATGDENCRTGALCLSKEEISSPPPTLPGGELGNSLHWPNHAMTSPLEECSKNVSGGKSKHVTRKKKKCLKLQVKPREAEVTHIFKRNLVAQDSEP